MADYLWRRGPESNRPTRICNRGSTPGEGGNTGRQTRAWSAWSARIALCWAITSPLVGCGGGGDAPLSTVQAQTAAKVEVAHLFCVLRADASGRWYIQDDVDHAAIGCARLDQFSDSLVLTFDRRFTHAGSISITSDDDFRDRVSGFGNLGVTGTRIILVARGNQIDPATVNTYVAAGAGNLWISVDMVNK